MIIRAEHLQKWIPADKAVENGLKHWSFGQGLLLAFRGQHCEGLSLFDDGSLGPEFVARLTKRFGADNFTLKFYMTKSMAARFQGLCSSTLRNISEVAETEFFCLEDIGGKPVARTHINVVNVDDSPVILKMLGRVLGQSAGILLQGQISDPLQAVAKIQQWNPDVVTMDIQMPGLNGVQVTELLGKQNRVPVLIVSSLGLEEGSMVYQALEKGAFDYVQKPQLTEIESFRIELLTKMELALTGHSTQVRLGQKSRVPRSRAGGHEKFSDDLLWFFGASTGGTQALTRVMTSFPAQIPPTLVVQHIPPVFSKSFAHSLNSLVPFEVKEAQDGEHLKPNTVYIAPGGFQMAVKAIGVDLVLSINDDPPVNRFKPSVDYLFSSATSLKGKRIMAGILTGMGKDGAAGLLALRKVGASTFAQDKDSSVVYGMPRAAVEVGATETVLDIDAISEHLLTQSRAVKRTA